MKSLMNLRVLLYAVAMVLILTCQSCCKDESEGPRDRTMLIYMDTYALSDFFWSNLQDMKAAMDPELSDYANLLVFVDDIGANSHLLHIHDYKCDTVRTWSGGLDSSSPETLSMVIDYSVSEFPAKGYGLVVWSHGTGWIPDLPAKKSPLRGSDGLSADNVIVPFTVTRALLPQPQGWMEIADFADAIPNGLFDFMMFDACHMGGAEVAYELKDRTKWLIASAIEIMGWGFPYRKVVPDLLKGNYQKVCQTFFEYYDAQSGSSRTAGIALLDLNKFDLVCDAFRDIVNNATVGINSTEFKTGLQRMDRNSIFGQALLFDLGNVAEHLRPSDEGLIDRFYDALEDCIQYHANTDYVLYGTGDCLTIRTYSGLNCFVPFPTHNNTYNPIYRDCGWNRAVRFLK